MQIESIKIKNFKALQDIEMRDIPSFCVVVGANGSGKSTLFDVFDFLKDCLTFNVMRALQSRGGFQEVISREHQDDTMSFEIQFRMQLTGKNRLVTYVLEIGCPDRKPVVEREILRYKRGSAGSPYHFMDFTQGDGYAVNNEEDFDKTDEELNREPQTVSSDTLALKSMGNIKRFKAAFAFRELLE
jgi:predicted ATPase